MSRAALLCSLIVSLAASQASAQSPELSAREFASGQIKKGVRSIGFGGDGATWGNYALVYRDAGGALIDGGLTAFDDGNDFSFTALGFTSPALWHGLAIYAIALAQHETDIHVSLKSPRRHFRLAVEGRAPRCRGNRARQAQRDRGYAHHDPASESRSRAGLLRAATRAARRPR